MVLNPVETFLFTNNLQMFIKYSYIKYKIYYNKGVYIVAIRNLRYEDDEILRKVSRPVKEITQSIIDLLDDMAETMYDYRGVGLAAPQVGILRQVVVIDIDGDLIEMINPEIIERRGEKERFEACLSIPGMCAEVVRPEYVRVRAIDRYGDEFEIEGEDMFAVCCCHEIDHLHGVLYKDVAIEGTFRENTPPPEDD